ncbi:hypothetical protein M422DRAFT_249613 [Sphaerobolus stellatus SS14]|uniref:Uncharacterized protein n=1 Tax=Sphaerobolus stellatus (strain SS14) TaxID=990650 RepID=A0A0C9UUX7_SPHS4|nr:hypothetical protein M422DRAFT_249613 [Sphaerobolus stellatus SS14]
MEALLAIAFTITYQSSYPYPDPSSTWSSQQNRRRVAGTGGVQWARDAANQEADSNDSDESSPENDESDSSDSGTETEGESNDDESSSEEEGGERLGEWW